jgi:CysZ protein
MTQPVKFITAPLVGATFLLRGLTMLRRPELRFFLLGPLLINLALYALAAWLGVHYFSMALDWLIPDSLHWLNWLLWPLFAVLLAGFTLFTFTLVANLIASPLYGPLSEKVLSLVSVAPANGTDQARVSMTIVADLASSLRRLRYFAFRALPLLLATAIPGVNLIAGFLWILFGAWSLSLEFLAYPLEAEGMGFPEQRELAKSSRMEALGFGAAIMFGLGIPVLNIFIPPAAVIGATLYIAQRRKETS